MKVKLENGKDYWITFVWMGEKITRIGKYNGRLFTTAGGHGVHPDNCEDIKPVL